MINDLGADGVRVVNGATDLGSRKYNILTDSEVDDLLTSYDSYRNSDIATRDVADVQKDIDQLTAKDDTVHAVENLDGAINQGVNSDRSMKGLDGEVETASSRLDDGVDREDITMDKDISDSDIQDNIVDQSDIDNSDLKDLDASGNSDSDIDVDVDSGAATEVKNRDYRDIGDFLIASDLQSLRKKLNTFAASGEDEIVVVTARDPDAEFPAEVRNEFTGELSGVEKLSDMESLIENNFNGVSVGGSEGVDVIFKQLDSTK
jgi:hypothetical protein